jgi:hypothetical protein
MEVSLVFEPSEIEIIETFEFEEDVQRPEELRFFTLDEQLIDYFQKVLPKKNYVTKAEQYNIKKEVDRIRKLHEHLVILTDTDYRIDTERREIDVPWLKSIYGGFDYQAFPYADRILPLHEDGARRTPNAYPVLLASLPRPYRSEGTDGIPITKRTELVNEDGLENIRALGDYVKTKREVRDDGSVRILNIPIPNTGDDIRRTGFFIDERPFDMPHPLNGHPFLSSSKAGKILTTEPLKDVFPTIQAILSHAVPVTTDPYGEGRKYLKVYDVQLSEIPWNSWKERFPPADMIKSEPPVLSITFPTSDDIVAPSDRLQKVYESKWLKSVYPRQWLMRQEDGGLLVTKMLLSDAGEFGLIAPDMINERPTIQLPDSTPEECLHTKTFEDFLAAGVYRRPGVCAPTAFVAQERQEFINKDKKAWTETTSTNIQKEYIALFKFHHALKDLIIDPKYEQFKPREESELHNNIRIILKDNTLLPPDKSYNIRLLIKEITPVKHQFLDVNGIEIICEHTLAQLDGDLEADRFAFYNKWATLVDGARVCTSCGEEINTDNYVSHQQYDDNGRLVLNYDILTNANLSEHPPFANSLTQLKSVFSLDNAGESILYILLSQMQILPSENQLIPILGYIRKGSVAAKKLSGTAKNEFEGLLGIAGMVTLLQIHNPFLIPRRSFGNNVVKLSGFPRDTDDTNDCPILNNLLSALTKLVEAYPSTFQEPTATILREITRNRKRVRDKCVRFIQQFYSEFRAQFESAKERAAIVVETVEVNSILLPTILLTKTQFSPGDRRGNEMFGECPIPKPRTTITPKLPPSLVQKSPELWKTKPTSSATYIMPEKITTRYTFPEKKEIEKGVKLGISKTLKLELIRKFVDSEPDGVAMSSLLSRLLDILAQLKFPAQTIIEYRKFVSSLNTFENPSLFRDAVKGRIYQLIASIQNDDGMLEYIRAAIARDLVINMIVLTKEESEKQVNYLRSRERETLKARLRQLPDDQREVMKMLIDIGISQYIIRNEDRKLFAKEVGLPETVDDDEKDPDNTPEEGFTHRDYVDGEEQLNQDALPIDPDRGDYGDMRDRPDDDYSRDIEFDEDVY